MCTLMYTHWATLGHICRDMLIPIQTLPALHGSKPSRWTSIIPPCHVTTATSAFANMNPSITHRIPNQNSKIHTWFKWNVCRDVILTLNYYDSWANSSFLILWVFLLIFFSLLYTSNKTGPESTLMFSFVGILIQFCCFIFPHVNS